MINDVFFVLSSSSSWEFLSILNSLLFSSPSSSSLLRYFYRHPHPRPLRHHHHLVNRLPRPSSPPHPPYLRLYRLSPSSLTRVHDDYPRASRHAMSIVNPPVSWKITDRGRRRWASLLDPRVHVSLHTYERINNAHIIYPFNIRLNPTVPFFQRFFLPRLNIIYRSLLFIIVLTILIYRNICDVYYVINVSIT